jgi:aspartyl-tRNA(Asn)/glutamyl-tRNA(Gln) amidotransferase subunit A
MDHVGPIALCVWDLALLLQTIAGHDSVDPDSAQQLMPNLERGLKAGLKVHRLGRLRGLFDEKADSEVRALMDKVTRDFQAHGLTVTEVALPTSFADLLTRHRTVMGVEAVHYHHTRLKRHPEEYQPNIRALLEEGLATSADKYARAKKHQNELTQAMDACFTDVDVLLTPATTGPAPTAETTGDPAFNSPWSYTGLPTISLPAGRSADGLPLAIQLIGQRWDEATLFELAHQCETILQFTPTLPPSYAKRVSACDRST